MMLDSEALLTYESEPLLSSTAKVSIIKPLDSNNLLICPTFAEFEFTNWKIGDGDSFCENSKQHHTKEGDTSHRFDVDAIPEPLEDDMIDNDYDAD
ncbi:hypothetical protein SK128_021788, partial [Halocaridina rubra]